MIIYYAKNKLTGEVYVGQSSKTLKERIKGHEIEMKRRGRRKSHFHSALMKYGLENFVWSVVEEVGTKIELNEKEKFWIKTLESAERGKGYNLTEGGTGGAQIDESVLRRMGESSKARVGKLSPRFGKPPWNKGKKLGPVSEEKKKRMSDAHRGIAFSEERKLNISKSLMGRHHSAITKEKIRQARLGQRRKMLS